MEVKSSEVLGTSAVEHFNEGMGRLRIELPFKDRIRNTFPFNELSKALPTGRAAPFDMIPKHVQRNDVSILSLGHIYYELIIQTSGRSHHQAPFSD